MPPVPRHTPGTFCWWELATTDADSAYRFYQTLFGWGKTDLPIGPDEFYRMVSLDGLHVGAMHQPKEPLKHPPAWLSYIAVSSADATAAKIAAAGGTILAPPFDVFDSGRMAIFQDTEGATAAIWQPNQHQGAGIIGENNAVCWTELAAKDAARARAFYTKAFDWTASVKPMGPMGDYTEWGAAGAAQTFGGMLQMDAQWGEMPAHWMVYFKVSDCDVSAAAAKQAGGNVMVEPFDAPGVGRIAVMSDPTGAAFSIIHLTMAGR
ncbi:MAG: VOC family protein [Gemmatimonadales bacterium]|nr:VOC family protein [Gemmatimonadales bacterium]